jgi:hypothetical protein
MMSDVCQWTHTQAAQEQCAPLLFVLIALPSAALLPARSVCFKHGMRSSYDLSDCVLLVHVPVVLLATPHCDNQLRGKAFCRPEGRSGWGTHCNPSGCCGLCKQKPSARHSVRQRITSAGRLDCPPHLLHRQLGVPVNKLHPPHIH